MWQIADVGLAVLFMCLGFAALIYSMACAYEKWKPWNVVANVEDEDA